MDWFLYHRNLLIKELFLEKNRLLTLLAKIIEI